MSDLFQKFESACIQFSINLEASVLKKLLEYHSLLEKWNKVINLSAHRSLEENLEKNFLDSLILSQKIPKEKNILDFGSGAGFPGLLLGIANSERHLLLVEADQRKSSFLRTCIVSLGLKNVEVDTNFIDISKPMFQWSQEIDLIVSRATISPQELLNFGNNILKKNAKLALMLSEKQYSSLNFNTENRFNFLREEKYLLPWSLTSRFIVILEKK